MSPLKNRSKSLFLRILMLSLIAVFAVAYYLSTPHEVDANLWPDNCRQFLLSEEFPAAAVGMPVSITPFDSNYYFLANYSNISILDMRDMSLDLMSVADKRVAPRERFFYNPAGLFYSPVRRLLYVASYTANNVAVFSVDIKAKCLELKEIIGSPHTVSPENVFVSDDGKYMVCANYDGSSATAFDISGSPPREIWNTSISLAHGVCILNNRVYVTGLQDRSLFELDLATGAIIRRTGSAGWKPEKKGFLWPTSVFPYSRDSLLLSDAHTGFIYLISTRDLRIKKYLGGNGPTYKYLNMPYCAIVHEKRFIVLSTFQQRMVVGNRKNLKISESVSPEKDAWGYMRQSGLPAARRLGEGWNQYTWEKGPHVTLLGNDYSLGYGHLHPFKAARTIPTISLSGNGPLYSPERESYFLNTVDSGKFYILFSPQRSPSYCIVPGTITYLLPVNLSQDCWSIENAICGRKEKIDPSKFQDGIMKMVTRLNEKRLPNGLLKKEDFREIVFPGCPASQFEKSLKECFPSWEGKKFLEKYDEYSSRPVSGEEVSDIADDYFFAMEKETFVNLDELMLVHMFTGYQSRKGISQ